MHLTSKFSLLTSGRWLFSNLLGRPTVKNALLERASTIGLGLAFRNAERLPIRAGEMFRQQNDLTNVIRGVHHRSVQRFEHRERFSAYPDRPLQIVCGQCLE